MGFVSLIDAPHFFIFYREHFIFFTNREIKFPFAWFYKGMKPKS